MPPAALLDLLTRFPAVIAAVIGLPVALLAWWTNHQNSRRQATKAEVDAVCSAAAEAGSDEQYQAFLLNIAKEKLVGMSFGCAIPLEEVGRVMAYYGKGNMTTRQLGLAWKYRRPAGDTYTFKLAGWSRTNYNFVRFYCWSCLVLATVMTFFALFPINTELRWQLVGESILFVVLAAGMVWFHRELYAANNLARLEKPGDDVAVPRKEPSPQPES